MVLFFTTTLLVSIAGLAAVLYAKHWELTTGNVLFQGIRPRLSAFFHTVLFWIERVMPDLIRAYSRIGWRLFLKEVHRLSALVVLHTERFLERTLHTIRHTTEVKRGVGQASAFLREVSEHKKKLLKTKQTPTNE